MTRTVYDSTNIRDDPAGADMVAYYCDGAYAVSEAAVRARFPAATLIAISAIGTNAGVAGDVEPGCMTIAQGIAWTVARRAHGVDPTIYCNEMNLWATMRRSFQMAHVPEPHYWVADYDGLAVIPAGAVAKQYANPPLTHGHFDKSIAVDYWPGVDKVSPNTEDDDDMLYAGPVHGMTVTLKTAIAGSAYLDPSPNALVVGPLGAGTTLQFIGYRYVSTPTSVPGKPVDHCWWLLGGGSAGQWLSNAILDTTPMGPSAPSPAVPAGEPLVRYFALAGGGSAPDDDSIYLKTADLKAAIGGLP